MLRVRTVDLTQHHLCSGRASTRMPAFCCKAEQGLSAFTQHPLYAPVSRAPISLLQGTAELTGS